MSDVYDFDLIRSTWYIYHLNEKLKFSELSVSSEFADASVISSSLLILRYLNLESYSRIHNSVILVCCKLQWLRLEVMSSKNINENRKRVCVCVLSSIEKDHANFQKQKSRTFRVLSSMDTREKIQIFQKVYMYAMDAVYCCLRSVMDTKSNYRCVTTTTPNDQTIFVLRLSAVLEFAQSR